MKVELSEDWRVALGVPRTIWLIQQRENGAWFTRAVVTERNALLAEVVRLCGDVPSTAQTDLEFMPAAPG